MGRDPVLRGVNRGSLALGPQPRARRRLDPSQGAWTRRRHTDGAQPLAAPLIRFARFYEASRPRPRSPPPGLSSRCGLGAGVFFAAAPRAASPHPGSECRLRRPRRAVQGATRRAALETRERTPQVESAVRNIPAHPRSRRSLATLGMTPS